MSIMKPAQSPTTTHLQAPLPELVEPEALEVQVEPVVLATDLSTDEVETTILESGLDVRDDEAWRVRTHQEVTYEVRFCDNLFDPSRTDLLHGGDARDGVLRRFVVIDSEVDRLHGERIRAYFDHHGVECHVMAVPADETVKNFDTVGAVVTQMDAFGIDRRREPVIVIGGGVLMDIVGLAASLYRRGTPFIRVPTTLIGLIDAGVGAKTGVNFNGHKNRLGTYTPAELTLLDRSFLTTLEPRHISNGLAEILKIALIKDAVLFDLLENYGTLLLQEKFQGLTPEGDAAAMAVLRGAAHGMLQELQPNLWEAQLERCVDYGHTFSPTVEMLALPALLHGEAVSVDMALTTILANHRGLLSDADLDRVFFVMHSLGLPSYDPRLEGDVLANALEDTVRHRDGAQRLPLPVGIGDVSFINDATSEELVEAVEVQRGIGNPLDPSYPDIH